MDNSATSSTNRSFGNVGEDSLHSVFVTGSPGGDEIMSNTSAEMLQSCYSVPLFESAAHLTDEGEGDIHGNNQSQSSSENEIEIKCASIDEVNKVVNDKEYNIVHASEEEGITKKEDEEEEDENDDDHWKLISAQQAECPAINTIALNQDKSCVAICTDQGYRIRSIPHNNDLDQQPVMIHTSSYQGQQGGLSLCQMLYCTSLLAAVAMNSPRTLTLLNAKTDKPLCQFNFTSSILNVELNRKIMLVLTSDGKLTSFDLSTSALKLLSSETILNSRDAIRQASSSSRFTFFDLSQHEEDAMSYYCITTSLLQEEKGYVLVRDAHDLKILNKVQAHTHSISKMIIGGLAHCQLFATSSVKGTMIHIYQLPSCVLKHNLYRGSTSCQIYNMAFTETANCIAVSGSSGTIHIYNLTSNVSSSYLPATKVVTTKIWNIARSFRNTASNALTTSTISSSSSSTITTNTTESINTIEPIRSFVKIKLKIEYHDTNIISIFPIKRKEEERDEVKKKEYVILVITMDGKILHYLIDEYSSSVKLINADELLFDGLVTS